MFAAPAEGPFMRPLRLLPLLIAAAGCNFADRDSAGGAGDNVHARLEEKRDERMRAACTSQASFDRLKELTFDEAIRIRGGDSALLDRVGAAAVVRMERPRVVSRDDSLNVTVCAGRLVLELPPGAENAFDGRRRIEADVEYAAQDAPDGSGLVFQMDGAEPVIYRLATVGGLVRQQRAEVAPRRPSAPPRVAETAPSAQPEPAPQRSPRPDPRAAPPETRPATAVRPSFNCRAARTRTEVMVCASPQLAAADRRMASLYYSQMANADAEARRRLRATRDRFLARRERCGSAACVAAAYEERVAEIRGIAGR
jgi:uncharacterized protein YecT (DUF1311 family)